MPNLKGQVEIFRRQLRALKFTHDVNFQGMFQGTPIAFINFYRHLLCDFNAELTTLLVNKGFSILGTTDYRFMEAVYRILRDLLDLRPPITLTQFYSSGFAERKLEMASQIAARLGSLINRPLSKRRTLHSSHTNHSHQSNASVKQPGSQLCNSLPLVLPGVSFHQYSTKDTLDPSEQACLVNHSDSECIHISVDNAEGETLDAVSRHTSAAFHKNTLFRTTDGDQRTIQTSTTPVEQHSPLHHLWAEESHNKARKRISVDVTERSSMSEKQRQCSTFSTTIPSVGQRNQSQLPRSQSATMNPPYVKQGNTYHLLNSNPRPCSYSSLFSMSPKTSKRPPVSRGSSANVMNALTATVCNDKPIPKISVSSRRLSNTSRCSDLSAPHSVTSLTNQVCSKDELMQEILQSLSRLTSKVDSMLSRMDHLETRFTGDDSRHISDNGRNHAERAENCMKDTFNQRISLDYQSKNSSHAMRSDTPVALHSTDLVMPSPTTTAEFNLSPPKSNVAINNTQTSSSATTIDMPYQASFKPVCTEIAASERNPRSLPFRTAMELSNNPATYRKVLLSPNKTRTQSIYSNGNDRLTFQRAGHQTFNENHKTLSRGDDTYAAPSSTCDPIPACFVEPDDNPCSYVWDEQKKTSTWSPSASTSVNFYSISRPVQPSTRPSSTYPSAHRPLLFNQTDSCDQSTNNSIVARSDTRSAGTRQDYSTERFSESYSTQVDRITSMLTETHNLLESQRSKLINGTA
ncbi:hypothetical protein PHET_04622 [Paragonimus heterotremus]|uniref:Centrosomal protein of 44 kDa n=1 Tax=Paragonimus heterotremus TaxID=100268 RepID=A0A8J4TLZ6_9TREM|nr:hypothetical protein PHET_04622 [Paragonimus heterotremus]